MMLFGRARFWGHGPCFRARLHHIGRGHWGRRFLHALHGGRRWHEKHRLLDLNLPGLLALVPLNCLLHRPQHFDTDTP